MPCLAIVQRQPAAAAATEWRGRSADARLLAELAGHGWSGHVHSVFARTVNLERADGVLTTLAASDCDNAPRTVRVEARSFGASGITVGDTVSASASCIRVGECFQLSMQGMDAWSGTLPAFNADLHRLAANLFTVKSRLGRLGRAGGMVPDPLHAGGWAGEVSALLGRTAALLRWSLSRGDCDAAVRHARSLLGLGPGLTPSGDDFLVGLFAVLNVARSPAPEWRSLGKDTLAGADDLTNAISLAALREAAGGRVRESMVELLRQMMLGTSAGLAAPMDRVLAIGSTSGADIVAGMVSGTELLLERARRVTMTHNTHAAGTLCLELQLNLERKHAGDLLP